MPMPMPTPTPTPTLTLSVSTALRARARARSRLRCTHAPRAHSRSRPCYAPAPTLTAQPHSSLTHARSAMVSHTSFSIDGAGAGGGGGGMPGTPVKKAVFGASGAGIGGGPIAMGGARGWMTSLPDRGGKAFGGEMVTPRPSLPIRFPELSPDSPDDSPAAGRSKLPTIDSNESPTMHQFWNPGGPDESPSLRPRRKSGETSGLARRKSAGGDISLNLGVRKQKTADSPKRQPPGVQRRSYGSLGLGRPGGREREPIPKFSFEESQENELGLSTGGAKVGGPLVASTSANSFLTPSTSLGVMPFMRRASSGTFSSDGEASVNGTPTRRGGAAVGGGMRGGLGGPAPALYNDRARPRPPSPPALALDPGAAPRSTPTRPDRSGARTRALSNPSRARRRAVTRARGSLACREVPRPPRFLARSRSRAPTFNPALARSLPPASLPTHDRVPNLGPDAGAARALPTPYWRGWRPRSIAVSPVR
ncbi:hypothetical protein FRC06_005746 [Ceratobasidium sp. 370]|nr:hypothetical protein FRC06_005746 [Ceratobasidium sp. 370]